jgi:hypothetical protein
MLQASAQLSRDAGVTVISGKLPKGDHHSQATAIAHFQPPCDRLCIFLLS